MSRYVFNVIVETEKKFNNENKADITEAIRGQVERIRKAGAELLDNTNIIISREVTDEDIAESFRTN